MPARPRHILRQPQVQPAPPVCSAMTTSLTPRFLTTHATGVVCEPVLVSGGLRVAGAPG